MDAPCFEHAKAIIVNASIWTFSKTVRGFRMPTAIAFVTATMVVNIYQDVWLKGYK